MSFVLRQITRRAGGGDIVRVKTLAAAEPVIGRGSDCDIQLFDLAVGLRHAVLRRSGQGRVIAEALGNLPFELNGAFVSRAEMTADGTSKLRLGNHSLILSAGERDGDVMVTVSANESAAGRAASGDQHSEFSLKTALISQRRLAWIAAILILGIGLAWPIGQFFWDHSHKHIALGADRQWSSGPLSPGHHFLEGNCEACHQQAFVAVRDTACLACHQDGLNKSAALQLAAAMRGAGSRFAPSPAGQHAPADLLLKASPVSADITNRAAVWLSRTFDHPTNRCASCHTEHVGGGQGANPSAPPPVTPEEVTRNDCATCHADMTRRLRDTRLSNVIDWGHHPDFRPLVTVGMTDGRPRLQQIALNQNPQEQTGLAFSHRLHLAAAGGVARMAEELGTGKGYGTALNCASCHRPDAGAKGFLPIEMTRDCAACHSLAFAGSNGGLKMLEHGNVAAVIAQLENVQDSAPQGDLFTGRPAFGGMAHADSEGGGTNERVRKVFAPDGTCGICHTILPPPASNPRAFDVAPVRLTQRYLPHGAFDHAIPAHHQDAGGTPTCSMCHAAESSDRAQDVLLPHVAECATCHGRSKQQTVMAAASGCAECHGYHDTGRPGLPDEEFKLAQKP